MPLDRFNQLRRRMLVAGASIAIPVIAVKTLRDAGSIWDAVWTVACVGVLAWVASVHQRVPKWQVWVPTSLVVAFAPVIPLLNGLDQVEVCLLGSAPVVVGLVFLDIRPLVRAVSITGWVSFTAVVVYAGWPAADVFPASGALAIQLTVLGMVAIGAERLRKAEVELQREHDRALRLSETRRAQAERLAIVGRLASGVAHEINNPLAYVKANMNALRRSASKEDELPPEELAELIAETTQGIDRICQIVADLKGFAREDTGLIEPVDLHEAVSGAVRLASVRLPRDTRVVIELTPDLPFVQASQRKLAQVLLNLLVNAGDALEDARTPSPTVTIRGTRAGDLVSLCITDNGPGISADAMGRLFEPFFTTKPPGKGTGLGLALSREYVEAFGGTLTVQNVVPRGAQFCISMKLSARGELTPLPGKVFKVA